MSSEKVTEVCWLQVGEDFPILSVFIYSFIRISYGALTFKYLNKEEVKWKKNQL